MKKLLALTVALLMVLSAAALAETTLTEYAVISVGKDNPYGAPHNKTLKALERHHMTVYRTDQNGEITINSTGNGVSVVTEK